AYVQAGMLPTSRAALYRDIMAIVLASRMPDQQERDELRTLLADVALELYQTRGRNFTVSDLLALFALRSPDLTYQAHLALVARTLDSGLLDVVAWQTYGFQHQMFQEYLAAVALSSKLVSQDEAEQHAAWDFIWRKHTYSRWREVLHLCVGVLVQEHGERGSQIAARWLRRLADERITPDGDVGNLCLELAVSSLREFSSTLYTVELEELARSLVLSWAEALLQLFMRNRPLGRLRNHRLGRLVEDVKMLDLQLVVPAIAWLEEMRDYKHQDRAVYRAVSSLGTLFGELGVTVSVRVLECAFPDWCGISLYASELPETLRTHASVERLVHLLLDPEEHWRVRTGAARLLGALADETVIGILCDVLEDTSCYYFIRVSSADALGKQRARMPVERLITRLQQDPDERIRVAAAQALSNAGDRLPLDALLAAAADTFTVYKAVMEVIRGLKGRLELEPAYKALTSGNAWVRLAAMKLLGGRVPVEHLQMALHDDNIEVRSSACELAGIVKDRSLIPALIVASHEPTTHMRVAALKALGAFGEDVPLDVFVEAFRDQNVYGDALKALQKSGRSVSAETLMALAREHGMIGRALAIARELHVALPVDLLIAMLYEKDSDLSHANDAAYLLGRMGQDAPIPVLLDLLRDPFSHARLGAAQALAFLAPHVPADPIIAVLQELNADSPLYIYLVLLLLRSGVSVSADVLVKALQKTKMHSNHNGTQDVVKMALGKLGEYAPIEALLQMVPDETEMNRWHPDTRAIDVLRDVYEWIAPEHLLSAAHHQNEDVHLALKIVGVMGKDAPVDLVRSILDDESRDCWMRAVARKILHEAGIRLPLKYFLAEADMINHDIDDVATIEDVVTIEDMRELGPQAPIAELLGLLVSNDKWVKHPQRLHGYYNDRFHDTVIAALRELAPYVPVETLIVALDSSNPLARKGAARVLGVYSEHAPIDKLIALLHNPQELSAVRVAALRTLAELQPYTPVEALTAVLRDDDGIIREESLKLLARWGRAVPLEPLLALLALDDEEYEWRDDVVKTLGYLQDRAPLDLLFSLLESSDEEAVTNAIWAFSHMGKYAPLDKLIAYFHEHDKVQKTILSAFSYIGEHVPLEFILPILDHQAEQFGEIDAHQLNNIARYAPKKFVALAKNDTRPVVRAALMDAIARLGQDAPVELALAALEDVDKEVRFRARAALLKLNVDPVLIPIEPLLQALREHGSEYDSHESELALLAKYGAQVPVEPLLALLGDSNPQLCENAARTLYRTHPEVFAEVARQAEAILHGEPVGPVFVSRLQSRIADRVRWIGRATPAVLDLISGLLDWPYWEVRVKATQALRAVQRNIPDLALKRLLELRHDPDEQAVRSAADEALAEILSIENGMEDE
ncbi:MAG TPA: HEAT repeat domain-containing protein, partial [Ktedonobacteraceae bacterium]|nr:HEAT repeat domain-containing protein [Ktedonobacteraceae bacterium]